MSPPTEVNFTGWARNCLLPCSDIFLPLGEGGFDRITSVVTTGVELLVRRVESLILFNSSGFGPKGRFRVAYGVEWVAVKR